jgi:hypothetical protein
MRQNCALPATVGLTYDGVGRELWLSELADVSSPGPEQAQAQTLCARHAELLTAPQGWSVVDRRSAAVNGPGRNEPDPAADVEPVPEVESAPEIEPAPESASGSPDELDLGIEPAAPSPRGNRRPRRGGSESMLDRAFAWAGEQRSVITERPEGSQGAEGSRDTEPD